MIPEHWTCQMWSLRWIGMGVVLMTDTTESKEPQVITTQFLQSFKMIHLLDI